MKKHFQETVKHLCIYLIHNKIFSTFNPSTISGFVNLPSIVIIYIQLLEKVLLVPWNFGGTALLVVLFVFYIIREFLQGKVLYNKKSCVTVYVYTVMYKTFWIMFSPYIEGLLKFFINLRIPPREGEKPFAQVLWIQRIQCNVSRDRTHWGSSLRNTSYLGNLIYKKHMWDLIRNFNTFTVMLLYVILHHIHS